MSCRQIVVRVSASPIGNIWSIPTNYYLKTGLDEILVRGSNWSDFYTQHQFGKTYSVDSDNTEFMLANVDIGGSVGPCQTTPDNPFGVPYFSNVILFMNFTGTNGSTSFIDRSSYTHSFISVNGASISTAQSASSPSSMYLNNEDDGIYGTGSKSFIATPDSEIWNFGTHSFTMEAWLRVETYGKGGAFISQTLDQTNFMTLTYTVTDGGVNRDTHELSLGAIAEGDWKVNISARTQFNTLGNLVNKWSHIAIVREVFGTGSTWRVYFDGTMSNTLTLNVGNYDSPIPDINGPFVIGTGKRNLGIGFMGWIDDVLVTKGIAKYTSNFIPIRYNE